ncbi:MAG TPA: lantibiotic immunity ABC transporter MutG family permease subunit [Gallicola sp.]|nr:lantibiotic immunity ABC transporter MutG family permease subunit [Gallicola sp.]
MATPLEHLESFPLLDLISIGLPFMISIVVTINIEQERQAGNFKGILLNENKLKYFFTKIFRLWVMGFLAIVFSVFLYELLIGNFNYMELVLKSILILTVTMLPTYLVHFFVDMRFSRNISIFLGAIEAMINAVFLTRLGDYLWKFFPCSWISRSLRYYSIIKLQNIKINIDYFSKTIVLIVTIIIVLFLLFWYRSWEGNNIEE